MAPKVTTISRHIEAPQQSVWDLLTDAGGYGEWNRAILEIEGPIELGNTIRLVSIVAPDRTFELDVSEMESPHRMVWTDGMPFGLFTGSRTYELGLASGGTEFTMTETFSGLISGLIMRSIPDMTDSFNLFADGLKAAAEA